MGGCAGGRLSSSPHGCASARGAWGVVLVGGVPDALSQSPTPQEGSLLWHPPRCLLDAA